MKLRCLGASQEVGRSAFLLKSKDNILFDYGLKLNPRTTYVDGLSSGNTSELPLKVNEYLDGIVLSHAHLDHSGAIPVLYKDGNCPLFTTPATQDLSNLLWKDTMKIAKFEQQDPIFGITEIEDANNSAFYLDFRKPIEITKNSILTFYDAGHIIGSTISVLETDNKKVMYTGDFRGSSSQMFSGYDKNLPEIDYLISETTYGCENHKDRQKLEIQFIEEVKTTLENGGIVILPAFAIERSQEIINILHKFKIDYPIYLDGMSKKATNIFLNYPEYFKDYNFFKKACEKVQYIKKAAQRKKIINDPCIIITTAGMLEGGPVLGYIKELGLETENKIIISGYQVEGTNGKRLLDTNKLLIDGKEFTPRCEVLRFSFSAHADKKETLQLIKKVNPKKVICVHGDKDSTLNFKTELLNKGIDAVSPKLGDEIDL
jgi:putative mRNA 3-end processing factor